MAAAPPPVFEHHRLLATRSLLPLTLALTFVATSSVHGQAPASQPAVASVQVEHVTTDALTSQGDMWHLTVRWDPSRPQPTLSNLSVTLGGILVPFTVSGGQLSIFAVHSQFSRGSYALVITAQSTYSGDLDQTFGPIDVALDPHDGISSVEVERIALDPQGQAVDTLRLRIRGEAIDQDAAYTVELAGTALDVVAFDTVARVLVVETPANMAASVVFPLGSHRLNVDKQGSYGPFLIHAVSAFEVATGLQGAPGPPGPKGDQGDPGVPGETGPQGLPGATGATGTTGATGPAGATGATGPAGPAGATGATGATGAIGPAGPIGPVGPVGPQGTPGPAGGAWTGMREFGPGEAGSAFVVPATVTSLFIEIWGAGGGGSSYSQGFLGRKGTTYAGAGGGAGGYCRTLQRVQPGSVVTVVVGAEGFGVSTVNVPGEPGEATVISGLDDRGQRFEYLAYGGLGGGIATFGTSPAGGAGGGVGIGCTGSRPGRAGGPGGTTIAGVGATATIGTIEPIGTGGGSGGTTTTIKAGDGGRGYAIVHW